MRELIYLERFIKFVNIIFKMQIEAGKMQPAYIFKSDDQSSPLSRVGLLEIELRESKVNGNIEAFRDEINGVKEWIEAIHPKSKKINEMHGNGATKLEYLTYSYSGGSFGIHNSPKETRFNFIHHHEYFDIIEYYQDVYKLLESVVPDVEIENNDIDSILTEIFPRETSERKTKFKKRLFNPDEVGYLSLTYVGTKDNLINQLKKLRKAGIDRNIIADVFSKNFRYQKRIGANEEVIKREVLLKKC